MRDKSLFLVAVVVAAMIMAACGGGGDSGPASAGKKLFEQQVTGAQPGCVTCHSVQPGTVVVGPSLAGIATRAATTVAGQSAEDYIRESILTPDAYLVEGFPAGTMPQVWGQELSSEQLNNVIAYLMTLK